MKGVARNKITIFWCTMETDHVVHDGVAVSEDPGQVSRNIWNGCIGFSWCIVGDSWFSRYAGSCIGVA